MSSKLANKICTQSELIDLISVTLAFEDKKQIKAHKMDLNKEFILNLDICDEAEATFVDDDTRDVIDDMVYNENSWPKEDPSGFSFKGKKKLFAKAVENIKLLMKKGNQKIVESIAFKVLDCRKMNHGNEYDVEVSKEKERGIAVLKIFGPNGKKEHTIMINKSKKHDVKFVELLAIDVIKPLLDRFGSGDGWKSFVKTAPNQSDNLKKVHNCHICKKGLCTEKNLKNQLEKIHGVSEAFICKLCAFKTESEIDFKNHDMKIDDTGVDLMDIDSRNEKDGNKRNRNNSDSSNPISFPPMKQIHKYFLHQPVPFDCVACNISKKPHLSFRP